MFSAIINMKQNVYIMKMTKYTYSCASLAWPFEWLQQIYLVNIFRKQKMC